MLNPPLHIICGRCGCKTMLSFEYIKDSNDDGEGTYPAISVSCGNCGTLTHLDEIIKDETNWEELNLYNKYV